MSMHAVRIKMSSEIALAFENHFPYIPFRLASFIEDMVQPAVDRGQKNPLHILVAVLLIMRNVVQGYLDQKLMPDESGDRWRRITDKGEHVRGSVFMTAPPPHDPFKLTGRDAEIRDIILDLPKLNVIEVCQRMSLNSYEVQEVREYMNREFTVEVFKLREYVVDLLYD